MTIIATSTLLREIHQVPPVLFSRGVLRPGEPAVSVAGSREASGQSMDWASAVSDALVSTGITVVSGLAAGIDTAAHTATLEAGGRTVAVIGTGINRAYPAANRTLQERIACEGPCAVPGFGPMRRRLRSHSPCATRR